jgi:hypothetical protein
MSTKRPLDRREFIAAAGSAAAVAYLPFGSLAAAPPVGAAESKELLADWSIDDQWGVYPRYDAHPFVPAQHEERRLAAVHPADVPFLA